MIELRAGTARATISTSGAEVHAWHAGGHDLLWSRDAAWWDKSSPVLFPIVGWAQRGHILVDGQHRPIGVHGFAAAGAFTLEDQSASTARLSLRDTAASRAVYPFAFRLTLTYALTDERLTIGFEVENTGDRPMPYALGLHPAFRWPMANRPRNDHAIVFERPERPDVPVIVTGGLFSPKRRPIPMEGRRLALTDALFVTDALCFLDAASQSFTLQASADGPSVTLNAHNFPHLALWSKPGAPFVSMEVWTGHGDPEGFQGELADKPSMRQLAPGTVDHCALDWVYRERAAP
ncbi:aldose 1-epimerase family protein [Phreatobacter aquaticus]|uniref:Aldose 1-epimerase family protein n=1 Tax=Phreatobacter aquaticus TaxID=2570229 RepID=A0A4D7QJ85_9HYPH|nr:aldose 1-epimerase family protein [Phreatobacter aquaticus]QCK87578.1 aldose 1-epimerase family protein [Phreatobacter aquaticus]